MFSNSFSIDPGMGLFPPTVFGSTSRLVVKINNNSDKLLRYEWRKYSTEEQENKLLKGLDQLTPLYRQNKYENVIFSSNYFKFENINSEIWPKRYQQIIVSFTPTQQNTVNEIAYLCNLDTNERIPFSLQGSGIPPHAELNLELINTGHICFDRSYQYQALLRNSGQIPYEFEIEDYSNRQIGFEFKPDRGTVNVGATVPININVLANRIGLFNEQFTVRIIGAEYVSPKLWVRGRVIGPTFDIVPKSVNFGTVSFGFLYTQTLEITNDSDIPFDFQLVIHQDPTFRLSEVSVLPDHGIVQKFSKTKVKLEFLPVDLKEYSINLDVMSPEYEKPLMTIPVKAHCICPEVTVEKTEIDVGQVFIGKKTPVDVRICNRTGFPAKYEYIEPTDPTILEASFEIEKRTGDIPAFKTTEVKFYITPKIIGSIQLIRYLKILGSKLNPLSFLVHADSVGPIINYAEKEIDFGVMTVLNENIYDLVFENRSTINADYKVCVRGKCFSIDENTGTIEPNSTHVFKIKSRLTDALTFTGEFFIIIEHLTPITIPLKAKGRGSPIVSSINMSKIDFGYSFVDDVITKQFTLSNHGTRPLEVKWDTKRNGRKELKMSIEPDLKCIYPGESIVYNVSLASAVPIDYKVNAICTQLMGKKSFEIFNTEICGKIIMHVLEFKKKSMIFNYIHNTVEEEMLDTKDTKPSKSLLKSIYQTNEITNKGELPLDVFIDIQEPFSASTNKICTLPGQTYEFDVIFDPSFKEDFSSETVSQTIVFYLENNPHKFTVDLQANLIFPNLGFDITKDIDFGIQLKNTESQKVHKMKNTSNVDVEFVWTLYNNTDENASNIFDVTPIRGILRPGESQNINFQYFAAVSNYKSSFEAKAVCHVIGGPDYVFKMLGKSADLDYKVSPTEINFGNRSYNDTLTNVVVIENTSQVNLPFRVKTPHRSMFSEFVVEPSSGVLMPGEMKTLNVSIVAGVPLSIKECFLVKFDVFQEVEIQVAANCFIYQLQTTIPRSQDDPLYAIFNKKPKRNLFKVLKVNDVSKEHYSEIEYEMVRDRLLEHIPKTRCVIGKHGQKTFTGRYNSRFVVDMESIVLGDTKEMTFEFTSITPFSMNFELFDSCLAGSGFFLSQSVFSNVMPDYPQTITFFFDTAKRTSDKIDDVSYDIPLVFDDESAYLIQLKAKLVMPALEFSSMHLDFEQTIVGQKRIKTVQIRNNNSLQTDFVIAPCESTSMIFRGRKEEIPFRCSTSSCSLPPNSFINIDIVFFPAAEKNYSMQFPITIKHNNQLLYLTVKGSGSQLKLVFDPPELCFPATLAFSEPLFMDFKMINPTTSPVTIFSNQFDFQLFYDQLLESKSAKITPESTRSNLIAEGRDVVNKFAICVIVHGVTKSGKTTVANRIANYLNLEILNLRDIFANKESQGECVEELSLVLKERKYDKGFIVDGLDAFPDPPESDKFISETLKHKGVLDEIANNPFTVFPHNFQTGAELCLSLLLSCLNGHFVIGVFVQATEGEILLHEIDAKSEDNYQQTVLQNKLLERYLNMNEEEYLELSISEQAVADKVRQEYRKKLLPVEEEIPKTPKPLKSSGSRLSLKSQKSTASLRSGVSGSVGKKTKGKYSEKDRMLYLFNFTCGTISQRLNEGNTNFHAIDPLSLRKGNEVVDVDYYHSGCCICINTADSIARNDKCWRSFIPEADKFRLRVLMTLISPQRLILPSNEPDADVLTLEPEPKFFGIYNTESAYVPQIVEKPPPTNIKSRTSRREKRPEPNEEVDQQKQIEELLEQYEIMKYTKRWEIPPGESVKLTAIFNGLYEGSYIDILRFSILDSANNVFSLPMKASLILPDLDRDPKMLYNKVADKLTPKTKNSFIIELDEYHFGSVIPSQNKHGSKNFKPAYNDYFTLKNNTAVPTVVTPFIMQTAPKNTWYVELKEFTIQPGEKYQYKIGFNPMAADTYRANLTFMIKDNANPLIIPIVADVTNPMIDLSSQTLDFEKLLPKQERTLSLTLKNSGRVPCYFKLKNIKALGSVFEFSHDEGPIPVRGSFQITVKYSSQKKDVIKKSFYIDLYDEKQIKVANTYTITVCAETFDTAFDFVYPKGMSLLDYGVVKVNETKNLISTLKNKGKYPLHYKFDINKNFQYIKISHMEGVLTPTEKPLPITFSFTSKKIVKFENKKVINLIITDAEVKDKSHTMPIILNAESTTSKYEISPDKILDFGPCTINIPAQKTFTIKNNGFFPFEFEITPVVPEEEEEVKESSRRSSRRSTKSKPKPKAKSKSKANAKTVMPKKNKKGNQKFTFGPYTFSTWWGTVHPNQSATITVDYTGTAAWKQEQDVTIKITDPPQGEENGIKYHVQSECFAPKIEVDNFENIFKGQRLCLRGDIEGNDCTAFLEDEKCLHFASLRVKAEQTVPLTLINTQPIPATVEVSLSEASGFKISSPRVEVPPQSESILGVTFSPLESESYSSILQAVVRANGKDPSQTLRLALEGKGSLPLIEFADAKSKSYSFGKTLVGTQKEHKVSIINTALIDSNVTFHVSPNSDFILEGLEAMKPITLKPNETFNFTVIFKPEKSKHSSISIQAKVLGNNQSTLSMEYDGEGLIEDLILDGQTIENDTLSFDDVVICTNSTKNFIMKNISDKDIRYQWVCQNPNDFKIIPSCGHLFARNSIEISVTFRSDKPQKVNSRMTCQWSNARFEDKTPWNDSMKEMKLQIDEPIPVQPPPSSRRSARRRGNTARSSSKNLSTVPSFVAKKVMVTKPEPAFTVVGQKQKDIILKLAGTCDDIRCGIAVPGDKGADSLNFAPTMMFESRKTPVEINNSSKIAMKYAWRVINFSSMAGTTNIPFSVEPSEGFVPPSSTMQFDVLFSPMTVDDFSCDICCVFGQNNIDNFDKVTPDFLPMIHATGLSRRPICHFDVKLSDYLKRRHPDYTNPLPEDIKVVEVSSKNVGDVSQLRFGIMNTTSMMYESHWKLVSGGDVISCETPLQIISSSRRYEMIFVYKPTSVKTVETLWEFHIPSHEVIVPFLIVGKVIPQ